MMEPQLLLVFFSTSVLLALAPGPDNLFVLAQSVQNGRNAGLFVTLGLCSGLLVHTAAVALGLAAVVRTSAIAFVILKFMGAAYLLYLAWQAFRAGSASSGEAKVAVLSRGGLYRRGIVMNISNPKVSLFFLAFLPQFADSARGPLVMQFFLLGGVFMLATVLVFVFISMLAGGLGEKFRDSVFARKMVNRTAGAVFVSLALRLALSER
ncbi:MAG: LysE family translocator [Chlorobiaceae bacterium]|nr:LysE family translocator [Chlorobiaceae bacterium]NTV60381.1 LysE family translocator [Chlorobiaceae bacterium]